MSEIEKTEKNGKDKILTVKSKKIPKTKKVKKPKGSVKLLPLLLCAACIGGIVWAVSTFKNTVTKNILQNSLEAVFGAKADIADVQLALLDSSLKLRGIAIANKKSPMTNLLELDAVVIDFDLLQLLKSRFVMDEIRITGIQTGSPRSISGLLPEKKQKSTKNKKNSEDVQKSQSTPFLEKNAVLIKELESRASMGITDILSQYNPQTYLNTAYAQLQSPPLAQKLESELLDLINSWKVIIEDTGTQIHDLDQHIRSVLEIKPDQIKTLADIEKTLVRVNTAITTTEKTVHMAENIVKRIETDSKTVESVAHSVENAIKADTDFLNKQIQTIGSFTLDDGLQIVSNSLDTMAAHLLMTWYPVLQDAITQLKEFQSYNETHPQKEKIKKTPISRFKGRTINFVRDSTPSFLIRRITLGAYVSAMNEQIAINGTISSISNNANMLNKPISAQLNIVRGKIHENIVLTVDTRTTTHAQNEPLIRTAFSASGYDMHVSLANPMNLVGLPDLTGQALVEAEFTVEKNNSFNINASINVEPLTIRVDPFEPRFIYDLYARSITPIKDLSAKALIAYNATSNALAFDIASDIDKKIETNIKKVVDEELKIIRKNIEAELSVYFGEIKKQYEEKLAQFNELKAKAEQAYNQLHAFVADLENQRAIFEQGLRSEAEAAVKKIADKAKEEAQKVAEEARKAAEATTQKAADKVAEEAKKALDEAAKKAGDDIQNKLEGLKKFF